MQSGQKPIGESEAALYGAPEGSSFIRANENTDCKRLLTFPRLPQRHFNSHNLEEDNWHADNGSWAATSSSHCTLKNGGVISTCLFIAVRREAVKVLLAYFVEQLLEV